MPRRMLLLRSLFFAIVVPGAVVVWLPFALILPPSSIAGITWTPAAYAAAIFISTGAAVLFWCIGDFIVEGRGTLAPIDPPTRLVRNGLYQYVRNPMYGGVLLVLLGEAALFRSLSLLTYTAVWLSFINLVVVFSEEPALRRRFDGPYDDYCRSARRWWPRLLR
jgi:protein-S-isoprenylcysteine O-methyltransferase Ste14